MRLSWSGFPVPALVASVSSAAILNVPGDHPTIQDAIIAATTSDTVLVEPGWYNEMVDFLGKEILVGSRFVMTGDTTYVSQTVIDGTFTFPVAAVRFENGETRASRLAGFTVFGGSNLEGAGIRCHQSSPTLDHLWIRNNWAADAGGGIYAYEGAPLVRECRITDNRVTEPYGDGGGIWAQYSGIVIDRCEIRDNRAAWRGAGIFCEHSTQQITRNVITGNVVDGPAAYYGGGIASRNCAPVIAENVIAGNEGGGFGGGLFY